jgi:heme/copper-type cytochrome/quinol oxidase subunit 2
MNDLLIVALVMPIISLIVLAIFGFGLVRYLNRHDHHPRHGHTHHSAR